MEDLGYVWSYEESIFELKQKLLYTTIELESFKLEANEETRKHKEDVKHLLNLLETAYKERDDAKDQLQKILKKLVFSSPTVPRPQPASPLLVPTKANSSITESNSLSDTYNNHHHSHGSSPVDSFFEAVNSPDFSSINMADSSHMGLVNKSFAKDYKSCSIAGVVPSAASKIDAMDARIDGYIKGKVLPEKGKLLQTVLEAGPLLQTLLVAGPLPRWRNPPPVLPYKIPPVSIGACETGSRTHHQKQAAKASCIAQEALNQSLQGNLSRGSSQMCSASMLKFSGCGSDSGIDNGWLLNSSSVGKIPSGKRQRFQ